VNEGSVPNIPPNIVANVGEIAGNYTEVVSFSPGSFTSSILWNAGQYIGMDGSTVLASQLGPPGTVNDPSSPGYGMYAFLQNSGTWSLGTDGKITLNYGGLGTMSLFIDPFGNTTFVAPLSGSGAWTTGGYTALDDILIAWGYLPASGGGSSSGSLDLSLSTCSYVPEAGSNCGSFDLISTFWKTGASYQFLTSPSDFWGMHFSGQFDNFTPYATQTIVGSLDATFIPEPESLALFGIGLMGIGLARRRTA
jgi:PEP-CTERM motif